MTPTQLAQAARREFGDARLVTEFGHAGTTSTNVFIEVRRPGDPWRRLGALQSAHDHIVLLPQPRIESGDLKRLRKLLVA